MTVSTAALQNSWNNVFQQLKIAVHSWSNKETTPVEVAKFHEMIKSEYKCYDFIRGGDVFTIYVVLAKKFSTMIILDL